jgi:hypothetical protein
MRRIAVTAGPISSGNAALIAASQAGTAGTKLTLTASPVVLDNYRRIIITSAADDSAHKFTVVGTSWGGITVTETLTGSNGGAAQSVYDYLTIVSITPVQSTTSTVTAGTNGVCSSAPVNLDSYGFGPTALQVDVTGTVSATVRQTLEDCAGSGGLTGLVWLNHPDSNLVNLTSSVQGNYAYAPEWVQIVLNSGTGSAELHVTQLGPVSHIA